MRVETKIDQNGLNELLAKIEALKKYSRQEVSNELGAIAQYSAKRAQRKAPKDKGPLGQGIKGGIIGKQAVVMSTAKYSPYVEFGTGRMVDLDDMQQLGIPDSYAAQFKGKGIREVNLPARPFFFNSIRIELQKGLVKIQNKLDKLTK
jgi:HK97 gp10 family phage protein